MTQSGDKCRICGRGRLATRTSKACGEYQVRYLKCSACGAQARSVVSVDRSWRRDAREKVV